MNAVRKMLAYLGPVAAPAGAFAVLAFALELAMPGSVSRWVDIRVVTIVPSALFLSAAVMGARPERTRVRAVSIVVSLVVLVALSAALVLAISGPGRRFLISALLATVIISYPVLRDVRE